MKVITYLPDIFTNVSTIETRLDKGTLHLSFKDGRDIEIIENVKFFITEEDESVDDSTEESKFFQNQCNKLTDTMDLLIDEIKELKEDIEEKTNKITHLQAENIKHNFTHICKGRE